MPGPSGGWTPGKGWDRCLDLYIDAVQREIMQQFRQKRPGRQNLNLHERNALKSLSLRTDVVIKPADKAPQGAPVKAGVWRVASPRTPSHAGSPAHVWLCVAFPCPGKRASWWLSRARGGTCESRCLESGVSTDPEPCGFARPRLAVRGFPVSGEKGILVVESNPGQASKRLCPEQVIAKAPETEHFVKFFVVHSEDNQRPAAKLSPFIVAKVLEHLIGHSYQAKKLHSGDPQVEVTTQQQSVAIQKMKSIVETSVTVTPHRTLNTVRGVISEEDLLDDAENTLKWTVSQEGKEERHLMK
ncbi:hypothetical protein ISCGN_027583 [Ixodes scapularis]